MTAWVHIGGVAFSIETGPMIDVACFVVCHQMKQAEANTEKDSFINLGSVLLSDHRNTGDVFVNRAMWLPRSSACTIAEAMKRNLMPTLSSSYFNSLFSKSCWECLKTGRSGWHCHYWYSDRQRCMKKSPINSSRLLFVSFAAFSPT